MAEPRARHSVVFSPIDSIHSAPAPNQDKDRPQRLMTPESTASDRDPGLQMSPTTSLLSKSRSWLLTETTAGTSMMPDTDEMKRRVRLKLTRKRYSVFDFYYDSGPFQSIARHHNFENFYLALIGLNSLYMAINADFNHADDLADALPVFQICENIFCFFFSVEVVIRFGAFKCKRNCVRDAWFVFDFSLVSFMVAETWIMAYGLPFFGVSMGNNGLANAGVLRLLRLLRLSRMTRMLRLLRSAPELVVLLKGILEASSSCGWTAMLLFIAMYIWGLALKQLSTDTDFGDKYFSTIPSGMYHLMITGCFMKGFELAMHDISSESYVSATFYFVFVLFAGVTVMKMLTGMLCKVVNAVAASEIEKMSVGAFRDEILATFLELGFCGDPKEMTIHDIDIETLEISHTMFSKVLHHSRAINAFGRIDVDAVCLVSAADFIFPLEEVAPSRSGVVSPDRSYQRRSLSFADFLESILELRGTNSATVKDMMHLRKFVRVEMETLTHKLFEQQEAMSQLLGGRRGSRRWSETNKGTGSRQLSETSKGTGISPPRQTSSDSQATDQDGCVSETSEQFRKRVSSTDRSGAPMLEGVPERDNEEDDNDIAATDEAAPGGTAERVFQDLCTLRKNAETPAPTLKRREQNLMPRSELNALKTASLCKLALCEGVSDAALEEAFETADAKKALVGLIMMHEAEVSRCSSDKHGVKLWDASRVRASIDIDYRAGMRVPAGTYGTVVLAEPKLLVDWDSLTTLDYATRMLEFTEVPSSHVESVELDIFALQIDMRVVVATSIDEEFLQLVDGQEGVVVSINETNGAFIDFFEAGRHMIMPHFLGHLRAEAERTRLLRLLSDNDPSGKYMRWVQTEDGNDKVMGADRGWQCLVKSAQVGSIDDDLPRCFQMEAGMARIDSI